MFRHYIFLTIRKEVKEMRNLFLLIVMVSIILIAGPALAGLTHWGQNPSMHQKDGYAFSSETQIASQVGDDYFGVKGDQVNGITWWGSFWEPTDQDGTQSFFPYPNSDSWGDPATVGADTLTGFNVTFYDNVPAGSSIPPWGHPGAQAGNVYNLDINDVQITKYGEIHRPSATQTVFQYDALFETPFEHNKTALHWLSIQAVNNGAEPIQWGWQESKDELFGSNAVQIFPDNNFAWWDFQAGEDMAFAFKPVPVPSSLLLLASGVLGFISLRRRQQN